MTTSPPHELGPEPTEAAAVLEATAIVAPPPRWVSPLFLILGIGLVPWTLLLAFTLPDHHGTNHYNLAWTGFDIVLAAFLVATAVGTARRAPWLQSVAAVAAALLACDAWFDVLSSTTDSELAVALALAVFVELPVAAACIFASRHAEETATRARRYAAYARRAGRHRTA